MTTVQILAVSALNRYVREMFESDPRLESVWIEGEVSNFRRAPSGHCYFTLKDELAQLRCVWFAGRVPAGSGLWSRLPRDGDQVVVHGRVTLYEPRGDFQLAVNLVQPAGVGVLQLRFEELRARLESEGLFDESRKRPIPRVPEVIGLVTSPLGAVVHDFLRVIGRRFPAVRVVVAPTPVQGEAATPQICAAIQSLNEVVGPDVIVVARGGGSLEDLWCFNEEAVARAIYGSRAPVVTGVGHETDVTVADLVADLRAPTPSAAAELVVPDARECRAWVEACRVRLFELGADRVAVERERLGECRRRLGRAAPTHGIADKRQDVAGLAERANLLLRHRLALGRTTLVGRAAQLAALSPQAVLDRGFAIVRHGRSGGVVRSAAEVRPGEQLAIRVADGAFDALAAPAPE
ncbi:MAG TPA: exodeoxyribonuclease VII large subunit [Chloroflexota bacterium]